VDTTIYLTVPLIKFPIETAPNCLRKDLVKKNFDNQIEAIYRCKFNVVFTKVSTIFTENSEPYVNYVFIELLRRHCTQLEHEKSGTHTTQTDHAATDDKLVQVPILAHERQFNQWSDSCQLIPQFSELIFNQRMVAQQLYSLVEKFKTTHEFTEAYTNEFKIWIKQSFRELMLAKVSNNADTKCQAFPHHEVMSTSNQAGSYRCVLDGSTGNLKCNSLMHCLVTTPGLSNIDTMLSQKRWC
jgi:hypothetical protein